MGEDTQSLGELLKSEGRTQVWLRDMLAKHGVSRTQAQINRWCKRKHTPSSNVVDVIATILNKESKLIIKSITKNK